MNPDAEYRSRPRADENTRSELGQNIERLRVRKGLSRGDLASALNITPGGVSAWEYGRTRPDIDSVRRLCAVLDVSADELLCISDRYQKLTDDEASLLDRFRILPQKEKTYLFGLLQLMETESPATAAAQPRTRTRKAAPSRRVLTFPVNPLSMCAGDGLDLFDGGESEQMRLIDSPLLKDCDELVVVSGHSMEPAYCDGDLAIVQHTERLNEGEIGVFVIDGEGMIKQYRKDGLYPLNPAYKPIHPGRFASVKCFGRVLGKVTPDLIP